MSNAFVIGYDPGGNGSHGGAAIEIRQVDGRWKPERLHVRESGTLAMMLSWFEKVCDGKRIAAAGVDTLTEWNSGRSGWRPGDRWLRSAYPAVKHRVVSPNSLSGSMVMNGAAMLRHFRDRFHADRTMLTEAHPQVCVYALRRRTFEWPGDGAELSAWLRAELDVGSPDLEVSGADHCFDAAVGGLAALRGLNNDWSLDLHALPGEDYSGRVRFCGISHYWWPEPQPR